MHSYERLALAYFAAFAVYGLWVGHARRDAWRAGAAAAAAAAGVAIVSRADGEGVRAWAPHAYLMAGYWIPALLVARAGRRSPFEEWLCATDRALRPGLPRVPRALHPALELAYLLCYPLVPIALVIVLLRGGSADVERFWTAVLGSGYACYVSLPWLVSRPPRAFTGDPSPLRLGRLNAYVLRRVSHELNTFPSGHVAVSCAAAGAVVPVDTTAGVAIAIVAGAVAVGAATGRYHYVVDVMAGVLVSVAWLAIV